jgi:hypothetical protein
LLLEEATHLLPEAGVIVDDQATQRHVGLMLPEQQGADH